ncbi:MAG: RnfABCDGE type electron transport complex subunit D [Acholeplasmatales bacterium]|nr:MAG: RnfABCDGE type electron transport complex subunit D [Acholeplasmatales bacterium]
MSEKRKRRLGDSMEYIIKNSPYLRRPNSKVRRMMPDVAIALSPLVIFAITQHGLSALWILLAAVLSMVLTEYLFYQVLDRLDKKPFKVKNDRFTLDNYTVLVSGLIYGLTLPDSTPLLITIIGGVVGVFLAKLVFGGMGQNIFNIAAFARVFVVLSFGAAAAYVNFVDETAGATALGLLMMEPFTKVETYSFWTMFSGIGLPGSLGETSGLLILVGGLYLLARRSFDVFIPLVYVGTVFVLSTAVMLQQGIGFWYPLTHIISGGLLFGAVFMATDPVTAPITRPGRVYFAFGLGVITFVIRLFGTLPEGVVFAILIMNMFVPALDYARWSNSRFTVRSGLIFAAVVALTILSVMVGASYVG